MSGKKVRKLKTEKEMETERSTAKKGQGEVGRPEENGPETGQRKKYIAYGSNLNLAQMARRCPTAVVAGKGELKDHELLFRGRRQSAVATVEPKEGASVPVLIWEIGPEDEKNLDVYEGYPRLYDKKDLLVETEGRQEHIMAYVMQDGREIGNPSSAYLETIAIGYLEAGFDVERLAQSVANCADLVDQEEGTWNQQLFS